MDRIEIEGGVPLKGQIRIGGAKNACLAQLPATLLTGESVTLSNVPELADVVSMSDLLRSLGAGVIWDRDRSEIKVTASLISNFRAHYDIVRKMRASFLVLGPLLAREGNAKVSLPGGCAIGERGVELHLMALAALGAELDLANGYVDARAPKGLRGARIEFPAVSVGATENAMMAATLARGESAIVNAAREPEISALADLLNAMGSEVEGAGSSTIRIQGVERMTGASLEVIPDRIEFGTYMAAAAITGGEIQLLGGRAEDSASTIAVLEDAGVEIRPAPRGIFVGRREDRIRPLSLHTAPYPGFPTDLQAQLMALLAIAEGESEIEERVFEHRFMHVPELSRMGADITIRGNRALIKGVCSLKGAPVMATDLRASMSLVLAALAADGCTIVNRVYHLDRGYERTVEKLSACGARIRRIPG